MREKLKRGDIMSMIPFENYNTVITGNSLNEIMIDIINPLGYLANFAVQVIAPTFPSIPAVDEEEPAYGLSDFLLWARPFKDYLEEGQDSSFYPLWLVLNELAKTKVRWRVIQEPHQWKRLVSLFVAHYMQKTLETWKDETNAQSLNPIDKEKNGKIELVVNDPVVDEYMTTKYGKMFWAEYKMFGNFADNIWGLHT
jgi:hypothetical protein